LTKRIVFVLIFLFMVLPVCLPSPIVHAENNVILPPGRFVLNKTLTIRADMENVTSKIVWWNNTYYIILGSQGQVMIYDPIYNKTVFQLRSGYEINYTIGFNKTALALLVIEYRIVNDSIMFTPYYWINNTVYKGSTIYVPMGYRLAAGFKVVNDTIIFSLYRIVLPSENFSSIVIEWNIKNNDIRAISEDDMAYTAFNALVTVISPLTRSGALMPGTSLTIAIHRDEIRSRFVARISLSYNKYVLGVSLTNIVPVKAVLIDHGNRVLGLVLGRTYSFLGRPENIVYAYLMGVYHELYVKRFDELDDIAVSLNKLLIINTSGKLSIYNVLTGELWRSINLSVKGEPVVLPDVNGDGGQEVLFVTNNVAMVMSLASLFEWRMNTGFEELNILGVAQINGSCFVIGLSDNVLYLYRIQYYGPRDDTPPFLSVELQGNMDGVSRALALKINAMDNESGVILVVVRVKGNGIDESHIYFIRDKHATTISLERGLPDGKYELIITSMNLVGLNTTIEKQIIIDHCPPRSTLL